MTPIENSIERIKNIKIAKVPVLTELINHRQQGQVKYKTLKGEAMSINLLNNIQIAVAKTKLNAGDSFHEHSHKEKEWLIFYSGKGFVIVNGEKKEYSPGKMFEFDPYISHSVTAKSLTFVIAITFPSDEGFPK